PIRVMISATDVNDRLPVLRELQLPQLLSVIRGAIRQAPRLPIRGFSDPDVPYTVLVEDPRHRGTGRSGDQLVRVRIAQNLRDGKWPIGGGRGGQDQGRTRQPEQSG